MRDCVLSGALLAGLRSGDAELDRGVRGPEREIERLREAGLLRAPLPSAMGGLGWGTRPEGAEGVRAALEDLGGASLSIARLYEGHVNAVRLVVDHATSAQASRVADAVRSGALMGVWAADSRSAPVRIDALTGEPGLAGAKAFASGLGVVSLAIVTARSAEGLQMVLVDAEEPPRQRPQDWDMDGMVGSRSGGFDCEGLPADPTRCLGAPDAILLEPAFHGGVWRLSACYAGALKRIAWDSVALVEARGGGGDPIMRHRLGEIAMEAQTASLWSRAACEAVEVGADSSAAVQAALFAREAVEQAATRQMALVERVGGTSIHGATSELGRRLRDLRVYLRQAHLDGKLALATSIWQADDRGRDGLAGPIRTGASCTLP